MPFFLFNNKVSLLKNHSQVLVAHAYILTTQETETRRIEVQSQPREIVRKTLSKKYIQYKKKQTNKQTKNKQVCWSGTSGRTPA
jgi:hypothetical protein